MFLAAPESFELCAYDVWGTLQLLTNLYRRLNNNSLNIIAKDTLANLTLVHVL